jgi:hypothetical protein
MPAATPPAVSPVEFVRSLSPEDREDVFVLLLRELIRESGGSGVIPVVASDGEDLGYHVPPQAADRLAEQELPKLSPERQAELRERANRTGTAIPAAQFIAEFERAAGRVQTQ